MGALITLLVPSCARTYSICGHGHEHHSVNDIELLIFVYCGPNASSTESCLVCIFCFSSVEGYDQLVCMPYSAPAHNACTWRVNHIQCNLTHLYFSVEHSHTHTTPMCLLNVPKITCRAINLHRAHQSPTFNIKSNILDVPQQTKRNSMRRKIVILFIT